MKTEKYYQIIISFSIITIVIHLVAVFGGYYGIFRDELYYIACANHIEFGYVDHPPLSIWILSAWKFIFGDSLISIRILPAFFSGLSTFLIGIISREFGGKKYGITLACLSSALAPIFLGFFSIYNMNFFEIILWTLVFLILIKMEKSPKNKYWLWIGLLIGIGALNKISMLWLGSGIFIGILLSNHRLILENWIPWLSVIIALVIFSPYLIWNISHDFAHLEFIRNAATEKYASQNPITFFSDLLLLMNPLAAPIWIAGFWFLLSQKEHRIIGFSILFVLTLLIINVHSKAEYFTSSMTALIPAGAVMIERLLQGRFWTWLRIPYLSLVILFGLILMPLTLDILPVSILTRYLNTTGIAAPSAEGKELESLPQFYADRFGWENMTHSVANVYKSLPQAEQKNTLIYGRNYGEAAAIQYFGKELDLPPVICPHNSYWYWSQKYLNQNATIIVIGNKKEQLLEIFNEVEEKGTIYTEYAMPYENNLSIYICRRMKINIIDFWKDRKIFI